jgi:hypothetical protein
MKTSSLLLRVLFGAAIVLAVHSFCLSGARAQATATSPVGPSSDASAQDLAAAKAAERKKHFEELKKRLEGDNPHPQETSTSSSSNTSQASANELSLSPVLVNMLVGQTQRFSLFDFAGHKLTSQADWSIDDSSVAELSVIDGVPTLVSKQTGTVRVRAREEGRSAEATVHVITPEEMKVGTILWRAPDAPGNKTVKIVPAVP